MSKPKILLVPDSPGWIFDTKCIKIIEYLSSKYDFEKVYWSSMPNMDYSIFDLVFYVGFWMIGSKGDKAQKYLKREQIVTSIPGFTNKWTIQKAAVYINKSVAYSVVNSVFQRKFKGEFDSKLFLISNGVDENLFRPTTHPQNLLFTIGWAGNSKKRVKRFEELITVVKSIPGTVFLAQTKNNMISYRKMPEFYNKLDCCCCTSISEGICNPLLEAGACAVPFISTPVGVAPSLLGLGVDVGIAIKADLSDLKKAIIRMRDYSFQCRKTMGINLRQKIVENFTWKQVANRYEEMFDYALYRKEQVK